jgi:hypothetical protein
MLIIVTTFETTNFLRAFLHNHTRPNTYIHSSSASNLRPMTYLTYNTTNVKNVQYKKGGIVTGLQAGKPRNCGSITRDFFPCSGKFVPALGLRHHPIL